MVHIIKTTIFQSDYRYGEQKYLEPSTSLTHSSMFFPPVKQKKNVISHHASSDRGLSAFRKLHSGITKNMTRGWGLSYNWHSPHRLKYPYRILPHLYRLRSCFFSLISQCYKIVTFSRFTPVENKIVTKLLQLHPKRGNQSVTIFSHLLYKDYCL